MASSMGGNSCGSDVRQEQDSLPARDVIIASVFLGLLQALDGVLTSIGIARFGTSAEGNPLLRLMMEQFGQVPTLAVFKIAAICIVASLALLARHLPWIKDALHAVSGVYLFAAILPWTYILYVQPNLHLLF